MRQAQALSSENLKTSESQIRAWINENSTVSLEKTSHKDILSFINFSRSNIL